MSEQSEIDNYVTLMKNYYINSIKTSCISHGMDFYMGKYRVAFKAENPGVETCSLACAAQYKRFVLAQEQKFDLERSAACIPQNLITNFNCIPYGANTNTAHLFWSYNLKTKLCYFVTDDREISKTNYINTTTSRTQSAEQPTVSLEVYKLRRTS